MTPFELQILQSIFQSISAMGIAGGFIYTAIQFKRWQRAAHVANFTKLVELQMQLRKMRVDDPALARIYQHDVRDLRNDQEIREHFMNLMQLSVYEIVWFSYKEGQVPRDYFKSWETRMTMIAQETSFRKMMTGPAMKILHDDFQEYMLDLVKRTPPK